MGYRVIGVRDPDYLNWRSFALPHAKQTPFALHRSSDLVGVLVLEFVASRARLVDLFRPERAEIRAGLQLALDLSAACGCSSLEVWCSAGSSISRILPWQAFIPAQATPSPLARDQTIPGRHAPGPKRLAFHTGRPRRRRAHLPP